MNPVRGYQGRNPLDPAQMRRFNYLNLGEELPNEVVKERFYQFFDDEKLNKIPNFKDLITKYFDFHIAVKKLLKERKIGADQSQEFIYDNQELPRRIKTYISKFYNGNINETMESALNYYYCLPLQESTDQKTVQKLTSMVKIDIPSDSRRIQLNKEISTPLPTSIGSISRAVEDGVSMGTKEDMSSHPDIDWDSFERDDSISGEFNPEELLSSETVDVLKNTPSIEEQFESDPVSPNKDRYELRLPHRGLFSDVDEFFGRPTSQNYEFIEDHAFLMVRFSFFFFIISGHCVYCWF
jgi:hypothetical protein